MFSRITRQAHLLSGESGKLGLIALFLFTFFLASSIAQAETSEWLGVYDDPEEGLVRLDLSIGEDDTYSLHYGEPRSCRMELEELMETGDKILLKVKETSGGFCDDIFQADLIITKDSSTAWTATLEKKSIDFKEIYQLLKE